jgi:hypothetical protein
VNDGWTIPLGTVNQRPTAVFRETFNLLYRQMTVNGCDYFKNGSKRARYSLTPCEKPKTTFANPPKDH